MKMVVGLGNPGNEYAKTRHNLGFMVADELMRRTSGGATKSRFRSIIGETNVQGEKIIVLKPQTFMNLSGTAVRETANWYKLGHDQMLIVLDDLDIPFGSLRLRPDGSAGGHNGLKSIAQELGGTDVPRLRIGIGRPRSATISHVLSRFGGDEERELPDVINAATDCVLLWISDGLVAAMNQYNRKPAAEAPTEQPA